MFHFRRASSHLSQRLSSFDRTFLKSPITNVSDFKYPSNSFSTAPQLFQTAPEKKREPHKEVLSPGQEIEGFVVEEKTDVSDFNLTAIKLRHLKSNAQYLHLDRDDSNNVFSLNFRTTPFDSSGVPHILEHITLCGSERFPCREVFFKMLSRSMATFLNAMTGPDYTMYPFATQNEKDFGNLLSVYLDTVLRPRLSELDFSQEGWRLEHEDINNPNSPIVIKGVVYNEMKGCLSENNTIFEESLLNTLLPSHTYGVNSGGDPLVIPSLTLDKLRKFHSQYYHPTNSRFYTYGNFDVRNHLQYINREYLDKFTSLPQSFLDKTKVPSEPRWTSPKEKQIFGREDQTVPEPLKQSSLVVSSLCADITDLNEVFTLQILSELLVKGPNSAFYKSLVESNLGSGFHSATGFQAQTKDTIFAVGLQGLNPDSFEKVLRIYEETVDKVISNGFDETHLKSILHSIELNIKHQSANFGLNVLFGLTPVWNHDGNIFGALRVNDRVSHFCKELEKNPKFLQDKVKQYFKDNPHRLTLTMVPDKDFEKKLNEAEKELIKSKVSALSKEELKKVYQHGLDLRHYQEREDDFSCLPSLKVSDIKKNIDKTQIATEEHKAIPIQISNQPTNGILYFRGLLDIKNLSESQKLLLPLFCNVASRMGTSTHNYQEFDQLLQLKTSGISLDTHLKESVTDIGRFEEAVAFSMYCLDKNTHDMFGLLSELLNTVTLKDLTRFSTLVKMIVGDLAHGIVNSGHVYAASLASSQMNATAFRKEQLFGLSYINRMKKICVGDLTPVLNELSQLSDVLFSRHNLKCALNMTHDSHKTAVQTTHNFIDNLSNKTVPTSPPSCNTPGSEESAPNPGLHYVLPVPVNFASKSMQGVAYMHEDFPKLRILCNYLSLKYLLPVVREKGGAYGAGVNVSPAGVISFYSYRDPNSVATFDAFDNSVEWLMNSNLSDEDIDEAKLSVFQRIDEPIPPSNRGMRLFLHGITDEMFQQHRSHLLKVTRDDVIFVANKYLSKHEPTGKVARALIGPENNDLKNRRNESWKNMSLY
nr:PREDICTED: presequence protease, mitochondrial [Bemisia tabaci]XP_018905367.1 PREDICTED: presequence protease, mitochondrial [Bemisia tabaci]